MVSYFLHLLNLGEPLQTDAVESWREVIPTPAEHMKMCFKEALEEKFIQERNGEFCITAAGRQKADDTGPPRLDEG